MINFNKMLENSDFVLTTQPRAAYEVISRPRNLQVLSLWDSGYAKASHCVRSGVRRGFRAVLQCFKDEGTLTASAGGSERFDQNICRFKGHN